MRFLNLKNELFYPFMYLYSNSLKKLADIQTNYNEELKKEVASKTERIVDLHVLGKIAVSDQILRKLGRFTPDEFQQMKFHAEEGARVADVYDALVSKRVYKEEYSFEKADQIILEGMGKQFDPRLEKYYISARPKLEAYYVKG